MAKTRAIPPGYRTVGEVAREMHTTVRTLQYYDKEGLLEPSAESCGGRRLYSDRDIVKLHQIQSLKYLGFSLEDIKNRLVTMEKPEDVADALEEQAGQVREKIESLTEVLGAIEKLREETLHMESVDWEKYADIIVLLQMGNEHYWLWKHFDKKLADHVRSRFDEKRGGEILHSWERLSGEALRMQARGVAPDSEQGLAFAKEWWDMVEAFTGGDMSLLPQLMSFAEQRDTMKAEWKEKIVATEPFVSAALGAYFAKINRNPFEEVLS